jgi:uncharacterized protein YggE
MNPTKYRLFVIAGTGVVAALLLIALGAAWLLPRAAAPVSAQTTPPASSQITVHGLGAVNATPDTLTISIGAAFQESTVAAAQAKVTDTLNAMLTKLKAAGIAEKDYQTTQYSVEPVMDYGGQKGAPAPDGPQTPALSGFRVTNMLTITLHDPARAAELIDTLVSAGANQIYGINYSFADQDSLAKQAYDAAVKDAADKAGRLAGLSNLKLGKILSVSETGATMPIPYASKGMGGGAGPIAPGQQAVQADLTVTYDALPNQ